MGGGGGEIIMQGEQGGGRGVGGMPTQIINRLSILHLEVVQ